MIFGFYITQLGWVWDFDNFQAWRFVYFWALLRLF